MKKFTDKNKKQIEKFLKAFSTLSDDLREEIVDILPAYNKLTELKAYTFEEFALLSVAKGKGIDYKEYGFDFKDIKPICPSCREKKRIRKVKQNKYICNKCKKTFSANHESISSKSNVNALTWMQVLICMLNYFSINDTCSICNISNTTYYNIRNKLFYAMEIMMRDLRLFGKVQIDNTFVRLSYKGNTLEYKEFPEDSPLYVESFVPRKARRRGMHNSHDEKNMNQICIFTAIDEFGHAIVKYAGIGAISSSLLEVYLNKDHILYNVPESEEFGLFKEKDIDLKNESGRETLIVADKERALEKYFVKHGYNYESHVYRKNGKQLKLKEGSNNIQKVNSLHKRLDDFLRKTNYVSGKYLPGFLTFFEFIENTKASNDAIGRLFEILTEPGLGQNAEFYKELYTLPNYMLEWSKEENPLRKFPLNKLNAAYLYNEYKKCKAKDEKYHLTVKEIGEMNNMGEATVRQTYRNFVSSGLIDTIVKEFENSKELFENATDLVNRKQRFSHAEYQVYKEYWKFREMDSEVRPTKSEFFEQMNLKYNLNKTKKQWLNILNRINKEQNDPEFPKLKKKVTYHSIYATNNQEEKQVELYYKSEKLKEEFWALGAPITHRETARILQKDYSYSENTIYNYIIRGEKLIKEKRFRGKK